jgi:hypothetical protein
VFDQLIQVLVFGCGYRRIADHTCSATTLRRRREEWISAGVAERLRLAVLAAYDRMHGLQLEHLAVDGCITKAPCGGQTAGPGPVDRRKQGLKRSPVTEAGGIPLGRCPPRPTVATTGCWRRRWTHPDGGRRAARAASGAPGRRLRRPDLPAVLAERGMAGEIATRGKPAPIQASRRWPVERTHPWGTSTASCVGAPSAAESWWSSGWRWRPPRSYAAGCSAPPGAATAGKAALAAPHDRLLAQALTQ